ncbi:MAG: hypothetical protein ACI857_002617 [Arenicella sp.]|jgi:hypothetical protein
MKSFIALLSFGFLFSCSEAEETSAPTQEALQLDTLDGYPEESLAYEEGPVYDVSKVQFQGAYDGCLPELSPTFKRWMDEDSLGAIFSWRMDVVYMYISTHLDSLSAKKISKIDSEYNDEAMEWEQYFEGGVKYGFFQHPEAGADSYLQTPCTDKAYLIKLIYPMIKDEDNTWNEDSTSYGPDGAGCHYDFQTDSINSSLSVNWYCGC